MVYNNISTLDGYLSSYPLAYKRQFHKLIAPDLAVDSKNKEYYETYSAQAYVFSNEISYEPLRQMEVESANMLIDPEVFKEMDGKYVFSRVALLNADELGLECLGKYTNENTPYTIWVYKN